MAGIPTAEAQAVIDIISKSSQPASSSKHPPRDARELVASARARALSTVTLQGSPAVLHAVTDHQFKGAGGSLAMRVYRPAGGVLPVLLYFHGGGFVSGSIESYDPAFRTVAQKTGWIIAAAEYRLAPEHPYPAAPEDCYAALIHLAAQAPSLGVDPDRIVAAGDSAGGLLAVSVALMTHDRLGPALAGIACLYPNVDLRDNRAYPSMAEHDGKLINLQELAQMLSLYLPDGVDRTQPYASPALAPDLTGLPPALILTCECDPLRDEGETFARRLSAAGVILDAARLDGMVHGVLSLMGILPAGAALMMVRINRFLQSLN
jgi:acetyl esterase